MGAPIGVPICTQCIEARRSRQQKPAANFGLNCDYFGQNCDMCLAHTRTRIKKIATYNVHPFGCTYGAPIGCPIIGCPKGHPLMHTRRVCICTTEGGALEPVTSRRRVDVRPRRKKKINVTCNGCPFGAPICTPRRGVH